MDTTPIWERRSPDMESLQTVQTELGLSRPVATALVNRDITTPDRARQFLNPSKAVFADGSLLPDMNAAVTRLTEAIEYREQILVYADRDVDGISACTILVQLFEELGANVGWYIPGKYEGYGMNEDAIEQLVTRGTELLLTVDCGTTASKEIRLAQTHGIDVIVTDHHNLDSSLPPATAVVNPRRTDSQYPHSNLAAGGVAYKLGEALLERHKPSHLETYERYGLPLAALATIGDCMEMNIENRALASEGFHRAEECPLPGFETLLEYCDVESVRDLRWSLVPFLNASQEDESGNIALELLFTRDHERQQALLRQLSEYQNERREQRQERYAHLERCFQEQVEPIADDELLVLVKVEQYVGGPAMSELSSKIGRPVITYRKRDSQYTGGGRTDPDVNILELFEECDGLLEDHWGHPGAAGFEVMPENLGDFQHRLQQLMNELYEPTDLRPTIEIDGTLEEDEITEDLVTELEALAPHGPGNEKPQFLLENLTIESLERFGNGDEHLRLRPSDDTQFTLIWWDQGDTFDESDPPLSLDLVGTIGWNSYEELPQVTIEACQES